MPPSPQLTAIEHAFAGRAPEEAPYIRPQENRGLESISSHELAVGFANYNYGLGITGEAQRRVDELLWKLGEKDGSRTADHGRRTGGYAGALARRFGCTPEQELRIRIGAALHDDGKCFTDEVTMHRTNCDEGWGKWDDAVDLPNIMNHPQDGHDHLANETLLPPETKFIAGGHHWYPEAGRPAYGIDPAEIEHEFPDDEQMQNWVHFEIFLTAIADKWEAATSRRNSKFSDGSSVIDYMYEYLDTYLPGQRQLQQVIIHTLQDEQIHYQQAPQPDYAN